MKTYPGGRFSGATLVAMGLGALVSPGCSRFVSTTRHAAEVGANGELDTRLLSQPARWRIDASEPQSVKSIECYLGRQLPANLPIAELRPKDNSEQLLDNSLRLHGNLLIDGQRSLFLVTDSIPRKQDSMEKEALFEEVRNTLIELGLEIASKGDVEKILGKKLKFGHFDDLKDLFYSSEPRVVATKEGFFLVERAPNGEIKEARHWVEGEGLCLERHPERIPDWFMLAVRLPCPQPPMSMEQLGQTRGCGETSLSPWSLDRGYANTPIVDVKRVSVERPGHAGASPYGGWGLSRVDFPNQESGFSQSTLLILHAPYFAGRDGFAGGNARHISEQARSEAKAQGFELVTGNEIATTANAKLSRGTSELESNARVLLAQDGLFALRNFKLNQGAMESFPSEPKYTTYLEALDPQDLEVEERLQRGEFSVVVKAEPTPTPR